METNNRVDFDRGRIRRVALTLFIWKAGLGVALIICGTIAVHYTRDQEDAFGPPYFIGAFVAGILLVLSSLFAIMVYRKSESLNAQSQSERKEFGRVIFPEVAFAILAVFSCFLGFFFVSWGLKDCQDPDSFFSTCNYTRNLQQNKRLAVAILIGLLLTVIVGLLTVYVICCSPMLRSFRMNNRFIRRPQGPVTIQTTQIVGRGTQQTYVYPTATAGAVGGQPAGDAHLKNLQEENRLLREQLELRQQLGEQQQRQPQPYHYGTQPGPNSPLPPPSYSECVPEPAKFEPGHEKDPASYSNYPHEPTAPPM